MHMLAKIHEEGRASIVAFQLRPVLRPVLGLLVARVHCHCQLYPTAITHPREAPLDVARAPPLDPPLGAPRGRLLFPRSSQAICRFRDASLIR